MSGTYRLKSATCGRVNPDSLAEACEYVATRPTEWWDQTRLDTRAAYESERAAFRARLSVMVEEVRA